MASACLLVHTWWGLRSRCYHAPIYLGSHLFPSWNLIVLATPTNLGIIFQVKLKLHVLYEDFSYSHGVNNSFSFFLCVKKCFLFLFLLSFSSHHIYYVL